MLAYLSGQFTVIQINHLAHTLYPLQSRPIGEVEVDRPSALPACAAVADNAKVLFYVGLSFQFYRRQQFSTAIFVQGRSTLMFIRLSAEKSFYGILCRPLLCLG